jgi:hypothetical protein
MCACLPKVAFHRAEPFDRADWVLEAKFDGFRAAADTVHGRLISRNGNRMQRFERVLDLLPKDYVFDGEFVVLDDAGCRLFNEMLFGHRHPTYRALRPADWRRNCIDPQTGMVVQVALEIVYDRDLSSLDIQLTRPLACDRRSAEEIHQEPRAPGVAIDHILKPPGAISKLDHYPMSRKAR